MDQNTIVAAVGGLVLLFGVSAAANWLRKDAARKKADKDPSNDRVADIEESAADALESLPIPGKPKK